MIISHQYKFILVTPPKTGSVSLHAFLSQRPFCDVPWTSKIKNQHDSFVPDGCSDYEIITVWRHPLDRVVSMWGHSQKPQEMRVGAYEPFTFEHFVREWMWRADTIPFYCKSQKWWLRDVKPTTVLRFTHLEADVMQLRVVKDAIDTGYELQSLQHSNRSKHPHWRRCYTNELQNIVSDRFQDDILFREKLKNSFVQNIKIEYPSITA